MVRSLGILTIGIAVTAIYSLYAVLVAFFSPKEEKIHQIARNWARLLLKISGAHVHVFGRENVLTSRPQIFMANHQSGFDIFALLAHIPGEFRWIAKGELFRIPVFGRAMRAAGYIPIDRENHDRAMNSLAEAVVKIHENRSVMSFPEGTRSSDGTIGPFKSGMFLLAIRANVPIVPVTIIGANQIWPKGSLKITPGEMTIVISEPVDVSHCTAEKHGELIGQVRGIIVEHYEGRVKTEGIS